MKVIITESQLKMLSKEIGEIGYNPEQKYRYKNIIKSYADEIYSYGQPLNIHIDIPYKNDIYEPENGQFLLFAYDKDKPVLMCEFYMDSDGIEIGSIFADETIRGQEIGIKIYKQLVKTFNLPLISGGSQTANSRYGIWEKLIKKYPGKITVVDYYGGKERPLEDVGIDTVYSDVRYRLKLNLKPTEMKKEQEINELFPEKILNLYKTDKETETFNAKVDFKLKFKDRITDEEYFQLNKGVTTEFNKDEAIQLSLIFGDYRQAYRHIYGFKYSKMNFGEPTIRFNGFVTKFKSYYLLDLKYNIRLPHGSGRDDCVAMFYNFNDLLKFFKKLMSLNIPKE